MTDIWNTRKQSATWLENELFTESTVIHDGFNFIERCINIFNTTGKEERETIRGQFSRVCAITLAKSNYFSLGCFELTLNALAQESGALLRVVIETYELLVYLRLDTSRVEEVINDTLPSAGKIAQIISGDYKDLRSTLNETASHFSYHITSVRHLYDQDINIMPLPRHSMKVLRTNLKTLNAFQVFVVFEAVNCLATINVDNNDLADEIEEWRNHSTNSFQE